MKIGLCQFDQQWEDKSGNKERIRALLNAQTMAGGADWVILPEMTLSGFSMNPATTSLEDADFEFFRRCARDTGAAITFGGVVNGQNSSITIDKSGLELTRYAKIHLFSHGGESKAYRSGGKTPVFELLGARIAPLICYDLRFPYVFWNNAHEVDLFVLIANWPSSRKEHWRALLQARAIENQCYIVGVNRTGRDPKLEYGGGSLVVDPWGTVVHDSGGGEGIAIVALNPGAVAEMRWQYQFAADRRTPAEQESFTTL